ncbi:MAG: hypothetical protein CMM25_05355 [Rhodospirillaceae bacterium]|nr:hypothetical protein [Rhodospirillaceae bacterium]|tara:strand:+ start:153 stop:368 length:216 start_codon:yes stop_codon:yes gene_type:complete
MIRDIDLMKIISQSNWEDFSDPVIDRCKRIIKRYIQTPGSIYIRPVKQGCFQVCEARGRRLGPYRGVIDFN